MFVDIGDTLSADGFRTSLEWADALLDEQRVAVTAGEAFDAPGTIRISYATSMALLEEGSKRLLAFVAAHAPQPAAAG
jgi:aspartate aminotransferase